MLGATDFEVERSRFSRRRLSLDRPATLPSNAPRGRDARDVRFFDSWIEHPGFGLTPASLVAAFRQAEAGQPQRQVALTADLVERDGHLRSLLEKRRRSVASKPWVMQPGQAGPDAELDARALEYALRRLPMIRTFGHLLKYNPDGYAGAEIDWDVVEFEGRSWVAPVCFTLVPARRFRIGTPGAVPEVPVDELRLLTDSQRPQGDELRPGKWITMRRDDGELARSGLCRTFNWLAMGKSMSWRDWLVLSEKYGLPMPIVRYDEIADDTAKDVGRQIIENIGNDGGALIPKSLELELHNGIDSSEVLQDGLIEFCNAEMSKLINGSTLANDNAGSGGASYALGKIHADGSWENVKSDAAELEEAFTSQVAAAFCRFNGRTGSPPRLGIQIARDFEPMTLATLGDAFTNKMGIKVSQSQMREECGLRAPIDEGDEAAGAPLPPAAPAGPPPKGQP